MYNTQWVSDWQYQEGLIYLLWYFGGGPKAFLKEKGVSAFDHGVLRDSAISRKSAETPFRYFGETGTFCLNNPSRRNDLYGGQNTQADYLL